MKIKTKKIVRTISKILDELLESESIVRLRIDSYEAIINSNGNIIGAKGHDKKKS